MSEPDPTANEDALRALARALAPYLVDEVRSFLAQADQALDQGYDDKTCEVFVQGLGDQVLDRALDLFSLLARHGVIDSVVLASALGVAPRAISGYLTTPLKRRAKALKLPLPFLGGEGARPHSGLPEPPSGMDTSRTHWQDRDGVSVRMLRAITAELVARRRRETESHVLDGKPLHTRNDALKKNETSALDAATDDEIWVFANTFQGYSVFGQDRLRELAGDATRHWERHRQIPRSLTLLRAVLFAQARAERMTDYDATTWAEHKWYMRTLAVRVAAQVEAGELEDEYETAVAWISSTPTVRDELWDQVTEDEARARESTQPGATFQILPSTLPENVELVRLMSDLNAKGEDDA